MCVKYRPVWRVSYAVGGLIPRVFVSEELATEEDAKLHVKVLNLDPKKVRYVCTHIHDGYENRS